MTQTAVEVDPDDETDTDAVEVAIALAVAEVLAHPPEPGMPFPSAMSVESILESTVGNTLRFYAQRVLSRMDAETPYRPEAQTLTYDPVQAATDHAVRQAIDDTGETVRDMLKLAQERAQVDRADTIEQGRGDSEAEALNRLRVGMASVSRVLTTRVREEAKEAYAVSLGAIGSVWRTRRDGRVRNSHGDLEGEFVRLGDSYTTVTGHKIKRPGDINAPLSETINCRCRLSYRMPT